MTDIDGVFAGGVAAGIKVGKKDLAFLFIPEAAGCAGVFTQHKFAAPCIELDRERIAKGSAKAVIVNSGCANAATGKRGMEDAKRTAELAASMLGLEQEEVLVASTGIIGKHLPMDKVEHGLSELLETPRTRDGAAAAEAILTTDLISKEIFVEGLVAGKKVQVAGFAKGSGMIAPNMATMLAFLVTDANLNHIDLQRLLQEVNAESFNMVSVDGDTSTSDLVLLFSTGTVPVNLNDKTEHAELKELVLKACTELAKKIARDGEGAKKLIEVQVTGAVNDVQARRLALNVVNSPLVKTAVAGADPNWGRIIMAIGKDPSLEIVAENVEARIGQTAVFKRGLPIPCDRALLAEYLQNTEVIIGVDVGLGSGTACAWGCDLTHGYIDINVEYN